MTSTRLAALGAVVAALLLAAPLPLRAGPTASPEATARANELGQEGDRLFKDGRYEDALDLYEQAWELAPVPVLLWNRARCNEELGRLERAIRLYGELRDSDIPAQRKQAVETRIDKLRARLVPAEPPPVVTTVTPEPPVVTPPEPELTAPPATVLRTNGLMLIVVSPIIELERAFSDHFSVELGLAFGLPVSGREFGLGGLLGVRWYPLQRAPDGWFVEGLAFAGGELSRSPDETAGGLFAVATGYQYLAWNTLALGVAAGPGVMVTGEGVIFYPALRADLGVAF